MSGVWSLLVLVSSLAVAGASAPLVDLNHDAIVPIMELTAQEVPAGIRPGAWMSSPRNCTMSWVLQDTTGQLYITTAGHCVSYVGQPVSVRGHGEIGTVLAFESKSPPFGAGDFALIRIHPDKSGEVDPSMAGWGGPVGMNTAAPATDEDGRLYGWGRDSWFIEDTRCREIVFLADRWESDYWRASGAANSGDSGSPVMTADGRAVGILEGTASLISFFPVRELDDWIGGYRLDYVIAFLENATGLGLDLVSAEPPIAKCGGF